MSHMTGEKSFNYNNNVTSDRMRRALIIIIMSHMTGEESFNYNNNVTSDRGRRALIIIIMSHLTEVGDL